MLPTFCVDVGIILFSYIESEMLQKFQVIEETGIFAIEKMNKII